MGRDPEFKQGAVQIRNRQGNAVNGDGALVNAVAGQFIRNAHFQAVVLPHGLQGRNSSGIVHMPHHEVAAEAVHGGHGAFQVHQPPRLEVSQAGDAEGLGKQVKGDALTVQGVHRQAATVDGDGIPQGKFMAEWNNQRQSGSAVDGRKPFHGSCCFNESGKHKSKLRFRPLMAEAGEEDEHDGGGKSRPGKQPQGIDALEVLAQNGLPRRVGDYRQAAARHGAGHHGILDGFRQVGNRGRQEGDGGIVVERCQQRGPDHGVVPQPRQHRFQPPGLDAAQNDQARQEEAHHHGNAQGHLVLVLRGSHRKANEEEEAADEHDRLMGEENRPGQKADVRQRHPRRYLVIAVFPGLGNGVVKLVELALLGGQAGEFLAEEEKVGQVGNDDG